MTINILNVNDSEDVLNALIAATSTLKHIRHMKTGVKDTTPAVEDLSAILSACCKALIDHMTMDEIIDFAVRNVDSYDKRLTKYTQPKLDKPYTAG